MTLVAIIEDDVLLQQLYTKLIPGEYELIQFYEPDTFKAAYNKGLRPDICLVDGRIPAEGDGVKLIQWIRAQSDPVPCVYASATLRDDQVLPRLKQMPYVSVLEKPIHPDELISTLENALNGQYNIHLYN